MTLPEQQNVMKTSQLNDHSRVISEAMKALQFQDPLIKYREDRNALDPLNGYRESLKAFDALKEYRESLKAFDALKEYRESLKAFDALKEYRESLKALDPLKEYRESLKALDPLKEYRESLKALDPLKRYREAMNATQFHRSMLEVSDALNALGLESILKTISRQEWPLAQAQLDSTITVNSDNTVTLDSTVLSLSEIQQIANEIADRAFNQSSGQVENAIAMLVAEISALKNPALEKFLSLLIYPIIVALIFSIVNPITDFYIKESLNVEKREIEKKIKKHVLDASENSATLDSYRLVSRNFLDVRMNPSSASPSHGRLYFGQVILLIEKRKDWSLVAWSDDENKIAVQGWVYSRYLRKFR